MVSPPSSNSHTSSSSSSSSPPNNNNNTLSLSHRPSGLAWRKPGEALRAQLVERDAQLNPMQIRSDCSIYKYYQVADQVLQQFLQHSIEEREELLQAYLVGMRLHGFLERTLPQHGQFASSQPDLVELKRRALQHLQDLTGYLQEIALLIDRQEHEVFISKVLVVGDSTSGEASEKTASSELPPRPPPRPQQQQQSQSQPQHAPPNHPSLLDGEVTTATGSTSMSYTYSPDDDEDDEEEDEVLYNLESTTNETTSVDRTAHSSRNNFGVRVTVEQPSKDRNLGASPFAMLPREAFATTTHHDGSWKSAAAPLVSPSPPQQQRPPSSDWEEVSDWSHPAASTSSVASWAPDFANFDTTTSTSETPSATAPVQKQSLRAPRTSRLLRHQEKQQQQVERPKTVSFEDDPPSCPKNGGGGLTKPSPRSVSPPTTTSTATTSASSSFGKSSSSEGLTPPPTAYISSVSHSESIPTMPLGSTTTTTTTSSSSLDRGVSQFYPNIVDDNDMTNNVLLMERVKLVKDEYYSSSMLDAPSSASSTSGSSSSGESLPEEPEPEPVMTTKSKLGRPRATRPEPSLLVSGGLRSSMDTPEEEAIWNVPGMIAKEADRHTVSTLYTSSASLGGGNGRICPATPLGLKRALQSPRSSQQQSKSMESTRSDWDPSSSSSSHGNTTRKSALLLNNKSKQPSDALLLIDTMEEEQSEIEVIPNRRYPRDSSGVVSGRPRGLQHFRSCVKFLYD